MRGCAGYVIFSFTGLAFSDVQALRYENIEELKGQKWIVVRRKKTNQLCRIPLPPAMAILEKYKGDPYCIKTGLVLPVPTNQKMNAYLHEIADLADIEKHLSTHTARHTFATTVTLSNSISIEVVAKMLGHSSINMTKKYARVVHDLISKDMMKIQEKYS
jgi:integrase